jgi:hypothetical protein
MAAAPVGGSEKILKKLGFEFIENVFYDASRLDASVLRCHSAGT